MNIAFEKAQKPWQAAAGFVLTRSAVAAALSIPALTCASADWPNPLKMFNNLFSGEKYETKIVPDVAAEELYNQALAKLQSKDYGGAAKKFEELEKQY